ncbi:MAG: hypothetical protein D6814_05445 [Calditrichaeota bacterium]|nr:MAG: hypothetical protein D6814_05445 [Calditrichota bacterium]
MKIELIFCHCSPRDEAFYGLLRQKKKALKRGADAFAFPLHKIIVFPEAKPQLLLELKRVSRLDARLCRIVELRYFIELAIE